MNVLKKINIFILIIFSIFYVFSFNVCDVNVDDSSNAFIVSDSSGDDVLIVDNQGDMYFEGIDHSLNNQNSAESFVVGSAYFNAITSKFNSFTQDLASLSDTVSNNLIIKSSNGETVAQFSNSGTIRTVGKGAFQESQAGCLDDGLYCNEAIVEDRDYYCNITGSKQGDCAYRLLSSEDCLAIPSTDTDGGIEKDVKGTVVDYDGCSLGECTYTNYTDSCSASTTLLEYYASGTEYGSTSINCASDNYYFCQTNTVNRYLKMYNCGSGACKFSRNLFIETCNLAGDSTYTSWTCVNLYQRKRIRTDYTNTCTSGSCGISSSTVTETQNAPTGMYCAGGSWDYLCTNGYSYVASRGRCEAPVTCSSGTYVASLNKCDTGPISITGSGYSQNTNPDSWFTSLHAIQVNGPYMRYINSRSSSGAWINMNVGGTSQSGQFAIQISNHQIRSAFWHGEIGWQYGPWVSLISGGGSQSWWNLYLYVEGFTGASRIRSLSGGQWINLDITGGFIPPTCPSSGTLDGSRDVCYIN